MLSALLSAFTSCIGNTAVFAIIPLIYWLIRYRKKENFFKWLGFYKPKFDSKWWIFIIFIIIFVASYFFDGEFLLSEKTINTLSAGGNDSVEGTEWLGLGVPGLLPAFIVCYYANGLCEELLFRGFLCKRFIHRTNVPIGIIISAVFFGLMHVVLVFLSGLDVGIDFYFYEFFVTGFAALLLGYANEKLFKGSIWPSIFLHGTVDFVTNATHILN